jgi:hypothetical protein
MKMLISKLLKEGWNRSKEYGVRSLLGAYIAPGKKSREKPGL